MKENDPLKINEERNINIKSSQNMNYDEIKPLPLPPMKNINQLIMNCAKNEEYCYSYMDFLKKFYHFNQIDYFLAYTNIEYCFTPKELVEMSKNRKQLKSKYSRDDPGFILIIIFNLFISSICFNLSIGNFNISKIFHIFFVQTFVMLILSGLIISLIAKLILDRYLKCSSSQSIEYRHAFDIHTNSFVSFYFFSIIIPYFLLPICSKDNRFFEIFISNSLFFYGLLYYFYVSYVEYFALPFIEKNHKINGIFWIIILLFFMINLLKINLFKVFLLYVVV